MRRFPTSTRPRISVITPAYNAAEYIEATISSVLRQSLDDWEMLVVDDGSTDGTASRVKTLAAQDARIRLLTSPRNEGPGPARNRALSEAVGRYVAFLDSDDLWVPEKLKRQVRFMESRKAYFTYTAYEIFSGRNQERKCVVRAADTTNYTKLLRSTNIGCLTVMIDRTKVGWLAMPSIPVRQPLVLWLRLLREYGPARGLDDVLAKYRVREGSISRDKQRAAQGVWRVYREFEKLSWPVASWCFLQYAMRAAIKNLWLAKN